MALLWTKTKDSVTYEVRTAGKSIRLYTDGVFHSQLNPARPFAGHLWDLLVLPALIHPTFPLLKNALILGVGGGTAIHLLQQFTQCQYIEGVDLNPEHLFIAKKFFGISKNNCELFCEDAKKQLKKSRKRYDLILEDVFKNDDDDARNAVRAIPADTLWVKQLTKKLSKSGLLIMNFESLPQLKKYLLNRDIKKTVYPQQGIRHLIILQKSRYENAIAVLTKSDVTEAHFTHALQQFMQQHKLPKTIADFSMTVFSL